MSRFILASQSPRRQELIGNILSEYDVIVSDVEEKLPDGIAPEEVPAYLAGVKARAVAEEHPEDVVIGADTVVILDGQVLGKPTCGVLSSQRSGNFGLYRYRRAF